jgi:cytidine deaminase
MRALKRPVGADKLAELKSAATAASKNAYCPYSRFPVGAAVLTEDGLIFSGCNVENASYGLTICAERNAVFQAVAAGSPRLVAVAIFTPTSTPSAPCGACRQVLNEFGSTMEVHCFGNGSKALHASIPELLTHAFGPSNLT